MKRINKNFFTALALTTTLISCSQEPSNSSMSDVISRGQSVIFYKTTFQNKPAIARRFCAAKDVTPTRTCDQQQLDSWTNEPLRPTTLLLLEDFQAQFAAKFGSENPKFFRENGTEILNTEITELEEFLKSPTLSEEEITQAKNELSKLVQVRGLKIRVNSIMKALSEEKPVSLLPFSEDFKLMNSVFTGENLKLHILDAATNLWWVYLGIRTESQARAKATDPLSGKPQFTASCSQWFNNTARLPTDNEFFLMKRSYVAEQLQEAFHSNILNSWTSDETHNRGSNRPFEKNHTACVISGS